MVVWSVVAVVEIDLGVVNLGDEAPHDLVLSEAPWDIHVFVVLPHWLACMGIVLSSCPVLISGLGQRLRDRRK
jgi:hypothetical protein